MHIVLSNRSCGLLRTRTKRYSGKSSHANDLLNVRKTIVMFGISRTLGRHSMQPIVDSSPRHFFNSRTRSIHTLTNTHTRQILLPWHGHARRARVCEFRLIYCASQINTEFIQKKSRIWAFFCLFSTRLLCSVHSVADFVCCRVRSSY